MASVWYRFRAELRTRWRSELALAFVPGRIAAGLRPATVLRSE
jgi:hypothetical protein